MEKDRATTSPNLGTPPARLEAVGVALVKAQPIARLRAGDSCPNCRNERLDYDGLLNLACPQCGYASGGCFN